MPSSSALRLRGWTLAQAVASQAGVKTHFAGRLLTKGTAGDLVGKELSAFANTEGGVLVYGMPTRPVALDDPRDVPVSIEDTDPMLLRSIRNWAEVHVQPAMPGLLLAAVELGPTERVIVAYVPQSPLRPHQAVDGTKRRYYRRTVDSTVEMEHAHVELLFRTRITQELARQPFVVIDEDLGVLLRDEDTHFHVVNAGSAPAVGITVTLAGSRLKARAALGVGTKWYIKRDRGDLRGIRWGDPDAQLVITYSDTSGARYRASYTLRLLDKGGGQSPDYVPTDEMKTERVVDFS